MPASLSYYEIRGRNSMARMPAICITPLCLGGRVFLLCPHVVCKHASLVSFSVPELPLIRTLFILIRAHPNEVTLPELPI